MCGIAGWFARAPDARPDRAALERMTRALAHRGPDGAGLTEAGACALGHRRLSIVDLAGGAQPMQTPDGRYTMTYNGEVYNHADLRARLTREGHVFRTRCDTEAVLYAYAAYGEQCVELLHGMFAFAVWDRETETLFLARDRLGQKPLFYEETEQGLRFASELHALADAPGFDPALDPEALHLYLTYLYVPGPRTIYRAARSLPPAHAARVTREGMRTWRYWRANHARKTDLDYSAARDEVRARVVRAASRRLMSDVPLGAFLSGGLDSSVTVAALAQAQGPGLATFTIGSQAPRYDERAYAAAVARRHGTAHHERVAGPQSLARLRGLLHACGQPFADSSILPTHQVCAFAREHVTVALSGDGADEAFAGYERYTALRLAALFDRLPRRVRRALGRAARALLPRGADERTRASRARRFFGLLRAEGLDRYLAAVARWRAEDRARVYGPRLQAAAAQVPVGEPLAQACEALTARDPVERWMELEARTYLPEDVLAKVDRAGMAVSLEVRSPFLDHELVEFAAGLPMDWKLKGRTRKHILADAFADALPPQVRGRPKMGFGIPVAAWLRGALADEAHAALTGEAMREADLFRADGVEALWRAHQAGREDASYRIWALLCYAWWREGARPD